MYYYWPELTSHVKTLVRICHECGAKKSWGKKRRSPLHQYIVGAPMERLAMDILGPLPLTPRGNRYVLVVTDYFTKWTESYAIPNQEAATVAESSWFPGLCVDSEYLMNCTVIKGPTLSPKSGRGIQTLGH